MQAHKLMNDWGDSHCLFVLLLHTPDYNEWKCLKNDLTINWEAETTTDGQSSIVLLNSSKCSHHALKTPLKKRSSHKELICAKQSSFTFFILQWKKHVILLKCGFSNMQEACCKRHAECCKEACRRHAGACKSLQKSEKSMNLVGFDLFPLFLQKTTQFLMACGFVW